LKKIILAVAGLALVAGGIYAAIDAKRANAQKLAEQKFIGQMIPHHADAIAMSNLAIKQAQTAAIKTLAANIIAAQQKEIDDMRGWYKSWYGKEVPKIPADEHDKHMGGESLAMFESAQDFDLEFVRQMIAHHEGAIVMAREVLPKARHNQITGLANAIIQTQQAEIDYMKNLQQTFEKFPPGSIGRNDLNKHCDSVGGC
jgi:uncharacterized protein (DUF305 family)